MDGIDFVGDIDDRNKVLDKIENELVSLGKLAPDKAKELHEKRVNK